MRIYQNNRFSPYRHALVFCLLFCFLVISSTAATTNVAKTTVRPTLSEIDSGYSALTLFLENQRYLITLIQVRAFLTREHISDETAKLIDSISNASTKSLKQLEKLASNKPAVTITNFPDSSIGMSTFDSLRMATAKELVFDSKNFEKNLLLTQTQILRVISHLATKLAEKDTDKQRKTLLIELAKNCENHYSLVYNRIALA